MSLKIMYPIIKTVLNTNIVIKLRQNTVAKIYAAAITNVGAIRYAIMKGNQFIANYTMSASVRG